MLTGRAHERVGRQSPDDTGTTGGPEIPVEQPDAVARPVLPPVTYAPVLPAATVPTTLGRAIASWTSLTASATVDDRERLRGVLGWRYAAHARAVIGRLALHPGLRFSVEDDVLAGLVALRAYLDGEDTAVNRYLRGEHEGLDTVRTALIARCASSGLRRLPTCRGPVFRPMPEGSVVSQYQPGQVIVEPGFTDVFSGAGDTAVPGAHYAIWPSSGRRVDRLCDSGDVDRPPVVFGPGTRFLVLSIEPAATADSADHVLLREVSPAPAGRMDGSPDDGRERDVRTVGRLRSAIATREAHGEPSREERPAPREWTSLGLDADGTAFALPSRQGR